MKTMPAGRVEPDRHLESRKVLEAVRQLLQEGAEHYFGTAADVELIKVSDHMYSSTGLFLVRDRHHVKQVVAKTLASCAAPDETKRKQVAREHEALVRCADLFRGCDSLGVPEPIALFPDLHTLVVEAVPGESLSNILGGAKFWHKRSTIEAMAGLCRRCGEWVRRLQDATRFVAPASSLDILGFCEKELAYLASRTIAPLTDPFLNSIRAHLRRLLAGVNGQEIPVAATHGGLAPYNVIVSPDGKKITMIDFASFRIDSIYQDYFKFCAKIEMLGFGPLSPDRVVRRFVEAFSEGYGQSVDEEAPLSQILRIGFVLDRLTAFVEGTGSRAHPLRHRLLLRLLFYKSYRWLKDVCRT